VLNQFLLQQVLQLVQLHAYGQHQVIGAIPLLYPPLEPLHYLAQSTLQLLQHHGQLLLFLLQFQQIVQEVSIQQQLGEIVNIALQEAHYSVHLVTEQLLVV